MSLKLPKNKIIPIMAIMILIIVFFSGVYFFVLYPKMEKVVLKENELKSQEQLLSTLQNKVTDTKSNTFKSTVTLQKMVPVKPLSQQLLLEIEKAEVVSGSFVVSISSKDGEVTEDSQLEDVQANLNQNLKESANQGGSKEEKKIESKENSLPAGIKKITLTLNIESPSYFELEEFINILENSERIIVIESIDFAAGEEIIEEEQSDKPLIYQVTLSAFYMPSLTDLMDQLPKMESPEPANKKNPFSNFGEYNKDKLTGNYIPTKDFIVKDRENVIYTVIPGDTIYELAIQFYNSNKGIQKIKNANGIVGNVIFIGQKLIIPFAEKADTVKE